MKTPRIVNAISHIDDDLISEAVEGKKKKSNPWMKWGSLAACLAILAITGVAMLPSLLINEKQGGTNDRYKDYTIQEDSAAIVWRWECRTTAEKYTELKLDGIEYNSRVRTVSEELVAEKLGTHTVAGYDLITEKKHSKDFDVYRLKYADISQLVAVKIENEYYVFKKAEYAPPKTLGELFALVDLPNAVELSRFSENDNVPGNKLFTLSNDDYVWEVLADCSDAIFVEDDNWRTSEERNYISFTVTSETLGVYKVEMYVTEDGYLWTNAFDYQYLFDIGETAADKIIKHAKENSSEAEYEPYQKAIVGKITEITDKHILVDDSVVCKNPADGITYRVLLNDLRISRYVDCEIIEVGDNVQITFEDEIYKANEIYPNTINSAVSVSKVVISDGDVLISE